ncbi:MAG: class I SAM-dependent rRNA methyltransferase [Planctomycetia bacterium]
MDESRKHVDGAAAAEVAGEVVLGGRGRRRLLSGHPWIFRDDVARSDAPPGAIARILAPQGELLGHGAWSAASKIAVRLVARGPRPLGPDFWTRRVAQCVARRAKMGLLEPSGACRLVAGDADGFPGLVVDRYADVLVVQSGTLAGDLLRERVVAALAAQLGFPLRAVLDRSDASARKLEGLEKRVELVQGALEGEVVVEEAGLSYSVDVRAGHKTGHYLDQRDNRREAARHARGASVLDAFCYDGLFGVRAALAGARRVLCLDQSEAALERTRANAERNGVLHLVATERVDCMDDLRERAQRGERHGLVIVDPPAFAKNRAAVAGAARGYVELNRRAFGLVEDGGVVVSASCSYNIRASDFFDHVREGAQAAGVEARVLASRGAAPDHSVLLGLPESDYLKCVFCLADRP